MTTYQISYAKQIFIKYVYDIHLLHDFIINYLNKQVQFKCYNIEVISKAENVYFIILTERDLLWNINVSGLQRLKTYSELYFLEPPQGA